MHRSIQNILDKQARDAKLRKQRTFEMFSQAGNDAVTCMVYDILETHIAVWRDRNAAVEMMLRRGIMNLEEEFPEINDTAVRLAILEAFKNYGIDVDL